MAMRSRIFFIFLAVLLFMANQGRAAVIDMVVAFVGDDAILSSELKEAFDKAKIMTPDITKREVLETLVNRKLLLREARKLFPETPDEATMLQDYMDLRIRAFIKVPEQDIRTFYDENRARFGGVSFEEVKDRIEALLQEKEVNRRLASHIQDLKSKAYVRTFLEEQGQEEE